MHMYMCIPTQTHIYTTHTHIHQKEKASYKSPHTVQFYLLSRTGKTIKTESKQVAQDLGGKVGKRIVTEVCSSCLWVLASLMDYKK